MARKTDNVLTDTIIRNIPSGISPVDFIAEELKVSISSAYRRLNGKMPFMFEEIAMLSQKLNFSVDEVITRKMESAFSKNGKPGSHDFNISTILNNYSVFADTASRISNGSSISAINALPIPYMTEYDALFRLFYSSIFSRFHPFEKKMALAEVQIPESVLKMKDRVKKKRPHFERSEFIIDRRMFSGIVREIQYFRRLKLISDTELASLQTELLDIIDQIEAEMDTGRDVSRCETLYYLSLLDIDTQAIFVSNGQVSILMYRSFGIPFISKDYHNRLYCDWLESKKKFSAMITGSNEFIRTEFIDKQRKEITAIDDENIIS
jgi:hypothetical protein